MDRDVVERQRPARKRPGLKDREFLYEHAIGQRPRRRAGADERRIEPERSIVVLMIEDSLRADHIVRLEMTMDEFGVVPLFPGDVEMLRRQQRHADQAEHGNEGQTAAGGHCGNYQRRPTAPSIPSQS